MDFLYYLRRYRHFTRVREAEKVNELSRTFLTHYDPSIQRVYNTRVLPFFRDTDLKHAYIYILYVHGADSRLVFLNFLNKCSSTIFLLLLLLVI